MDNFIVSARKYRPDTFHTVVGQQSITDTLKNAIKNGQLAQAYLFCGPRGVGKTTCARIFAKTINCMNLGAYTEPCNTCESCMAFNESRSYNIHELDAASNNSVEDIRTLIEQVRIPPQVGTYSVYIIDEVHMLSQAAFNAFLKTLEEPPRHAVFVLATTEKHKIIPTILSRCQIFDFNRITIADTVKHLSYVAESEAVGFEVEGLNVIAHKADGAMRDALSIFDQIVSFAGKNITYKAVIDNLNVLDYEYYFRLIELMQKGDVSEVLLTFNEIINSGFDAHHFVTGLSNHFRDLLVCKDQVTLQLLEVGGDIKERYKKQAATVDAWFLVEALQLANECDNQYKTSLNKRLLVELALIKMAQLEEKKKKPELDKNINELLPIFRELLGKTIPTNATVQRPPVKPQGAPLQMEAPVTKKVVRTAKSRTVSINAMLSGTESGDKTEQKKVVQAATQEQVTPFTFEELLVQWKKLQELFAGQPLYATLIAQKPVLKENHKVIVPLDHSIQEQQLWEIKPKIIGHLHRSLKNTKIEVEGVIMETERKRTILTDHEKLQKMIDENPVLAKFKQKFQLDLGES